MTTANDNETPVLLMVEDVAGKMQVDRATLWRWTMSGRFPVAVLRLGRARRIRAAEFDAWVGAGCPAGRERWNWPPNQAKLVNVR